jgi:hypothetical protein
LQEPPIASGPEILSDLQACKTASSARPRIMTMSIGATQAFFSMSGYLFTTEQS